MNSTNTTSPTNIILNKLEELVTMPIYYLVIAGAIVLLIILYTCCCCKERVVIERVKEIEVEKAPPIIFEQQRVNRARDIVGRKRYSSGSEV